MAEGKLPFAPEDSDEEEEVRDLEEDDIETAIQRLTEYNSQMQQDNKGMLLSAMLLIIHIIIYALHSAHWRHCETVSLHTL